MSETKSGFSDDERAAMKQRADEIRATKGLKGAAKLARELEACVKAVDALDGVDQAVAARLHAIVLEEAPDLDPKTFYGFPAYARDGKVLVFYQPASKFKTRYGTVNFDDIANLDDGEMWPVSFAVIDMTDEAEQRIRELVRRAAA